MDDHLQLLRKYTIGQDKKIKNICSPLVEKLNIPVFSYFYMENTGSYGYLSNKIEFTEYYFQSKIFLQNPFLIHPSYLHSGQAVIPCNYDDNIQSMLKDRFQSDHIFLSLNRYDGGIEGFILADYNCGPNKYLSYIPKLELIKKYCRYFKIEAHEMLEQMKSDAFNIQEHRGEAFFQVDSNLPLSTANPKSQEFLKLISRLSKQEQRCLDLFKEGKSAQATAAIMCISRRTVEHYFENIKNKLGCYSKWELLNY